MALLIALSPGTLFSVSQNCFASQSRNMLELNLDLVTLILVVGLTFLGSWFKQGSLVNKLERASHLAKDCGELIAAMGAVITFSYVFYEPFLHVAFKIIFLSYMYGQILGYILTVITNYLRSSEESDIAPVH